MQACTNQNAIMNDTMTTIQEISKLIGASAKRQAQFDLHQEDDAPSLRPMCPTRWTVRLRTLKSVASNMKAITSTLSEIAHDQAGRESSTKARGLLKHLETFEFLFGMELCSLIFECTDSLSCTLQSSSLGLGDAVLSAKVERWNNFFQCSTVRNASVWNTILNNPVFRANVLFQDALMKVVCRILSIHQKTTTGRCTTVAWIQ